MRIMGLIGEFYMASSQEIWEEEVARHEHNERVRKRLKKFAKTGKMTDDEGNEIDIGSTVNYEVVEKCE
jgi:hypothetical protein